MMFGCLSRRMCFPRSIIGYSDCSFSREAVNVSRRFASPGIQATANIFDRKIKRVQKNRAASHKEINLYDYLKDHAAQGVVDRLQDVLRTYDVALDLGCGRGHVARHLTEGLVQTFVQCDLSDVMLNQSANPNNGESVYRLVVDEEFLPFQENTFDLVTSSMALHWVNDLPRTFNQVRKILKEDGVFIGCMVGGESLFQLRTALQVAETELIGGFRSHVSPFAGASDIASLISGAGLSITTIDPEEVVIHYPSLRQAMKDLRGMGESNATANRSPALLSRKVLARAEEIYQEYYGVKDEKRGTVLPLTFDIIHFIGWKPSPNQPKPARRGSGSKDVLDEPAGS